MINEQHEEYDSKENNDHQILSINQNSSGGSLPKNSTALTTVQRETNSYSKTEFINDTNVPQRPRIIRDSRLAINSDAKEIEEIIQIIVKAVFHIIDNSIGQLANHSSNTLGMRVKDSLLLKIQQTRRKEIPFNELKTSLVCRLIVDDDLQIRFLPRIESTAPSSASENLSTKQKKCVSLAEEVKVFDRIENELFSDNEIGYFNELMDSQNDRIMNRERTQVAEDEMYDFTSQKSFTSLVESESSFFNKFNTGTTETRTSLSQDQKIQMHKSASNDVQRSEQGISSEDLKKFDNSGEKPTILSNTRLISDDNGILQKAQTNDFFARDGVLDVPNNLSIAPSSNANQLIVGLVETTPKGNADTELIQHGEERLSGRSKTSNEGNDGTLIYDKEQLEQDQTASTKEPSILNVDIEIKLKKEEPSEQNTVRSISKISHNLDQDNLNDGSDENFNAFINVGNEEEIVRKRSSNKNTRSIKHSRDSTKTSVKTFDFPDKTVSENSSEEKKKTKQIKKWMNKFVYSRKKNTRDKSKAEDHPGLDLQSDQSFKNSNQKSSATIAVVTMEFAGTAPKLGPNQAALESNNEDQISEKGTLGIDVSAAESVVQATHSDGIVSEKTAAEVDTVIEKKDSELPKIDDKFFSSPQNSSLQRNSELDLENVMEIVLTSEAFDTEKIQEKISGTLSKIKSKQRGELTLNDEELKMKSIFNTKTNNLTNSSSLGKTSSRVSLKANKLSKKSSRTESSGDQQSTNDLSLKQTSSKVSQKACKSSGKLSRTDINDVIISGPHNPAVETFPVSSQARNEPNRTDAFLVADANADENKLELIKEFKSDNKPESSLKKIQVQAYPVLSSAQIIIDNELDKVEIKSNRSHWSLFSKKSSAKLRSDKQEISERAESSEMDTENFEKEPMRRKKSMLNVVSKFSKGEDDVIRDNLPQRNDPDITDNKSSKSFLEFKTSKVSNKSDDTLIALQLHGASVNTNIDQSDHPMEPFTNSEKRNRFIEGLKRSLQSRKSRSKRSEGKSETKLKVSSESQTDIDKEYDSESLTMLKNGNDIEQSLDTKLSSSSKSIRDDILIDRKEEARNVSLADDEDSRVKQKSRSFNRFLKESTEKESRIMDLVEYVIQKSISEVSKQLAGEPPTNIAEVYSAAVDSELRQNHFSNYKIHELPSSLDPSQDLAERNSCNINESDTKSMQNELEFVLKSSEDLGSKPEQIEESKISFNVNKSFARILQKLSEGNSSERISKCLNDDELPESKDTMQKRSSKDRRTNEENAVDDEEEFSRKSEPIESKKNSYTDSKSEMDKSTINNSSLIFTEESESLVVAYVVKPFVQDQSDKQTIIGDKIPFDSNLIINETSEQLESHDLMTQNKEKHGLLSNIRSIFKSSKKSELEKNSIVSIEDPENVINRTKIGGSPSEIDVEKEQSVHFMRESVEIPPIQSMKSLQDNRKRSKNRRRSGHKLFNHVDPPFIAEMSVEKSYQATVPTDLMLRQSEEKTKDFGVGVKANSSEESVVRSNFQILLTDEEEVEEETAGVSDERKKSEKQQNPEGNTKKFAISLSRIFSNYSRKKNSAKEFRPAADSQTNPEDHFEITRIPLSSSDDYNTKGNDCEITQQKSEATEDNREELVAIKSLDSMRDSDNHIADREPIVKRSSRVLGSKYTTEISKDERLRPGQSGTVIFSAPIKANHISSENELVKKDSLDSVQEMRKPSEKIHIVSYAPMVESAKYISDEHDDRSNDDDQSEKRRKRSSGKSFATVRKLFTRASMRSRQDQVDHEVKKDSFNSVKSSIIKHRKDKDHSVDQLKDESNRESIISIKIRSEKRINDDRDEDDEQKNCLEIKKLQIRSKEIIFHPGATEDIKNPVVYDEVLLVNNVQISRNELANTQSLKNRIDNSENGTKPAVMQSNEVYTVDNKVEPEHDGLKPKKIVERVVDEIVIPPARQKDLNNTSDVVQKLSQRSRDTKKDSLLSTAKSYIKRHTQIEKEVMEGVNRCADKKSGDEDSITPSIEDLKKTSKEQGLAKTESVFSRGLKKLFKKRSSAVESVVLTNDSNDTMIETETHESGKSKTKITSNDLQFSVYNVNSKSKCIANYEEGGHRPENRSFTSLDISETHMSNGFRTRANPESKTCANQEKNVPENQFQTKISSKDFRQNPSFANRRSTIVMMATPVSAPRREPQTEVSHSSNDSHDDSSNSPTAFYYLLGPSLDEALVDVRVVFKNLIDKIIGRGR